MKLHVQCDRCKKFEQATADDLGRWASAPKGWFHLRAFCEPVRINAPYGMPEGTLQALLCGDCMPVVQRATEAAMQGRM